MALEIIGHVVPDMLARVIGVSSSNALIKAAMKAIVGHTKIIDIGTNDIDRRIWDGLAKLI